MISEGKGGALGVRWWMIWDLRVGEDERRRRVPSEGEWRRRRDAISFGRERPAERITRPPLGSSRSSAIMRW